MCNQTIRGTLVLFIAVLLCLMGCNRPTPPIGCSVPELITAINNANANPDHDHIILPEDCYFELGEMIFEVPDPTEFTDYEYTGLPLITTPITITGNGSHIYRPFSLSMEEFRIFYIGPSGRLALVDMYLEGGGVKYYGGAVLLNGGTLTLTQCVVTDNRAHWKGGAIANKFGELVLTNSILRYNTSSGGGAIAIESGSVDIDFESVLELNEAYSNGGAIHNQGGELIVYNSTIRDNTASNYGGGIFEFNSSSNLNGALIENNLAGMTGGGLCINSDSDVTIQNSTIVNNQAGSSGGGIGHGPYGNVSMIQLLNTSVSGNTAGNLGGGVYIYLGEWEINGSTINGNTAAEGGGIFNKGLLNIVNSTISGNSAEEGGGVLHASQAVSQFSFVTVAENTAISGGGLEIDSSWMHVTNSLVALNTPQNCLGNIQPFGVNLDDDGSCGFDITENPLLEPLGDNGGPTYTHAIPSFSPAAEVADPCTVMNEVAPLAVDQRGELRPQGAGCDLGAYEASFTALPLPPMPSACIYEAIKNSNCRESDHGEAPVVAILMMDETAELVALNPENTYGKFELPSSQQCWIALSLMSALDPAEECPVAVENPPEPELPEPLVCNSKLGKNACKNRGGKWVEPLTEAPYCSCP